ncbi:FxLYD domain-containing protein [Bacillus sp. JJ1532]|uniref:FxLYD domain-containing protein n=1 Tax=Bacillus sp. JJ1532 TaxID=3122958 RepID=UPI002FFDAF84
MYCRQCGEKLLEDSRFCSHCGSEIQTLVDEITDEPTETETRIDEISQESTVTDTSVQTEEIELTRRVSQEESNQCFLVRILPIVVPIVSVIMVVAGLGYYYVQEQEINREVLGLKGSAEELALNKDFEKAMKLLEKAQAKRPNYSALQDSKEMIEKAIDYDQELGEISERITKMQYDAASKELASLKEMLNGEKAPLFEHFHQEIKDSETKITVGMIKKEINALTTVNELGGKLSILATLPEDKASVVKQEILKKIVQISSNQAESELANKQFSNAYASIDKGLQFAVNDEKLLALKNRVEQDKNAFEQAEQLRIEQAMEAAAKEDLQNRTAAVKVTDFTVETDEFGDLYIAGNVNNVATTNISSITIYYTIYDENGGYLTSGSTSVYPYYLGPGESGSFEDIYYGVHRNVTVDIDNITWYLN